MSDGHYRLISRDRQHQIMEALLISAWQNGSPQIGDVAEMRRTVTATDIERFTEISGDRNPLHYDLEAARASRFGEIVVQGGVTSAILNAVVAEQLPGPGTVFLNVNWNFTAPVADDRAGVLHLRLIAMSCEARDVRYLGRTLARRSLAEVPGPVPGGQNASGLGINRAQRL